MASDIAIQEMVVHEVTSEDRRKAVLNICGSPSISNGRQALLILDMLGLRPEEGR